MEGMLLYWGFERKVKFGFIRRPYLLGNVRDMQRKALETGNSIHRGPTGEPEGGGGSFIGDFERQQHLGSIFFWTQRMLGASVWRQSGTLVKKQGSLDLASEYGAQTACHKGLSASGPKGLKPNYYSYVHLAPWQHTFPSLVSCHMVRMVC